MLNQNDIQNKEQRKPPAHPVELNTERLILTALEDRDIDLITEYCQEPQFEHLMITPWPYERHHAEWFVREFVPDQWTEPEGEATWAIREEVAGPILGVICIRYLKGDVGYYLGAEHRGNGYLSEALAAVCEWGFDALGLETLRWQAVVGNTASAAVARSLGFHFTGLGPSTYGSRFPPESWHAERGRTVSANAGSSWSEILQESAGRI